MDLRNPSFMCQCLATCSVRVSQNSTGGESRYFHKGNEVKQKQINTDKHKSACFIWCFHFAKTDFFIIYPQSPHHRWDGVSLFWGPGCGLCPHRWLLRPLSPYLLWSAQEHLCTEVKERELIHLHPFIGVRTLPLTGLQPMDTLWLD